MARLKQITNSDATGFLEGKIAGVFRKESDYGKFLFVVLITSVTIGMYNGMLSNYLAESVGMGEFERGLAEFFRELPGLLLVFVLAAFYKATAERLFKMGTLIMALGAAFNAVISSSLVPVIIAICLFSFGEHIQLGMNNTIALNYSEPDRGGKALGFLNSCNNIGKLAGYLVVAVVFIFTGGEKVFRAFFAVMFVITAFGFASSVSLKEESRPDESKRRFYFKKKFYKFYMLEVFYGARKQVFFTFGPYVLVLFYGASTWVISLLFAISAVACSLLSPVVGQIIDKYGYKIVMISDTLILVIVCFFYGFAHHFFPRDVAFVICCVNYILDSVISLAAMASNVYVQDISDSPDEMRATISTGFSVNHMITVLIALFGGWIWQTLGMEALFILSAALGLCNSAYAATIKVDKNGNKRS